MVIKNQILLRTYMKFSTKTLLLLIALAFSLFTASVHALPTKSISTFNIPKFPALVSFSNPILKKPAHPVKPDEIKSPAFAKLIDGLEWKIKDDTLVGLSAPQIGVDLQVFLFRNSYTLLGALVTDPTVVINPTITEISGGPECAEESCASKSGHIVKMWRPSAVTVEYIAVDSSTVKEIFSGFAAQVIQHEIHHLEGITIF